MPNGLWPARENSQEAELKSAVPSSAFSKGDILTYDSDSSISRIEGAVATPGDIAGVAAQDSDDSFNDQVNYYVPRPDTEFFSDATPNSQFTEGEEFDFDVDGDGRPVLVQSQNTQRFVVTQGTNDVEDQSIQSKVIGRFIYHAGDVDLS